MKKINLWVYGTLKEGRQLHPHYMKNATLKGTETIEGELYKIGWYPAFFDKGDKKTDVVGEHYEIPLEDFNVVRVMEENSGYKTKELITNKGNKVHVFCYMNTNVKKTGEYMKEF